MLDIFGKGKILRLKRNEVLKSYFSYLPKYILLKLLLLYSILNLHEEKIEIDLTE